MSMWAPFTEEARRSIVRAQEVAQQHGDAFISHHHIFVALADDGDVARALSALGIDGKRVREAAAKTLGEKRFTHVQEMAFTAEAKRMIELAFEGAHKFENNFIAQEHLALAYIGLEEHSQILAALEINVQAFRELLIASLSEKPKHHLEAPRQAEPPPRGNVTFEEVYRKASNFEGRRTSEDLWNLIQSAAEKKDLARVFIYAFSIAVRESIAPDELLSHIEKHLGES